MGNKKKVEKAAELILKANVFDEKVSPEEIYEIMKESELFEIAEELSGFVNLIYDLRDILEGEDDGERSD